jgi:hypothetical protein
MTVDWAQQGELSLFAVQPAGFISRDKSFVDIGSAAELNRFNPTTRRNHYV